VKLACPRCRSNTTKLPQILGNRVVAYCELCGWNIPTATTRIRTDIYGGWGAVAVGLVLVLLAWRGPWGFSGALGIGIVFVLMPASMALLGQYRLSRIGRAAAALPRATNLAADVGQGQRNSELDRFCLAPRPRQVKMTWLGRLYVVGVAGATVLAMWLFAIMAEGFLHPVPGVVVLKAAFGVLLCGWLCSCCFAFFRNRIRERALFANGDFARGTVATRTEGSQGTYIVYVFQTTSGRGFQKRVFDFSKNQFEQMPVHVFYDPLNPSRSAALEASVYRVL